MAQRVNFDRVERSESFAQFLGKEGLITEAEDAALKAVIADQLTAAMKEKKITKTAMAARMKTGRRQPASAVGRKLRVELE